MSEILSSPKKIHFRTEINVKVCLFAFVLLPLLLGLGSWQLHRAEEKRTIQQLTEAQQALPAENAFELFMTASSVDDLEYRQVYIEGYFNVDRYWLIENKTFRGKNGYHVVVPFKEGESGNDRPQLLVNLGWVPASAYREQLPKIDLHKGLVQLRGRLKKPSGHSLLMGAQSIGLAWPKTILQVEVATLEADLKADSKIKTGRSLHPLLMQIDSADVLAFQARWSAVNVSVGKHLGYAYQWFSMALALIVLVIFTNSNLGTYLFKRNESRKL